MEKRSSYYRASIITGDEFEEDEIELLDNRVKLEPPASVRLRSNYPGNLISTGAVTGKRYAFMGGGSTLDVDALDAPGMLARVFGGNSCCGSGVTATPQFIVVEM